jgi:hypothetical protein
MAVGLDTPGGQGAVDYFASLSPDEWNNYLSKQQLGTSRFNSIASLQNGDSSSSSSDSSSSSNTTSNGINFFGGTGGSLDDYTKQAKDLAQFNLGLSEGQSTFDQGLRNQDADLNLKRQQQLNDQTYGWQEKINNDTQDALTGRLNSQLQNNLQLQQGQIDQQNNTLGRAIALASSRLGSR